MAAIILVILLAVGYLLWFSPEWSRHLWNLLYRSHDVLLAWLGTTLLNVIVFHVIVPALVFAVTVFYARISGKTWQESAAAAMRPTWISFGTLVLAWSVLFSSAVVTTIYRDHKGLVEENTALRTDLKTLRAAKQEVSPPDLFYDDYKQRSHPLKDAQVTLESQPPPGSLQCWPHVFADMPNIEPNRFFLCGIWMKKPTNAADLIGFGARYVLYVDLSQPVKRENQTCPHVTERPDPPYVVTLQCGGITMDEPTRWVLSYVNAAPIPQAKMKVRFRFEYPKGGKAEAAFTLHPPKRELAP